MADLTNLKIKSPTVPVAANPIASQRGTTVPAVPMAAQPSRPSPGQVQVPRAATPNSQGMTPTSMAMQAYQESGDPFTAFAQGFVNSTALREQFGVDEARMAKIEMEKEAERQAAAQLIREQFPGQENLARGVEIGAWDAKAALDYAQSGQPEGMPAGFRELQLRAEAAGLQPGTPEHQQFMLSNGNVGADQSALEQRAVAGGLEPGTPAFQEFVLNGGPQEKPAQSGFNVSQATAAGYADRMAQADAVLANEKLIAAQTNAAQVAAGGVPLVGNWMKSAEYQQAEQAQRDFINAILRRESGAVIADSEFENAKKQYFPQPGDTPEVIQQKAANRRNAINGVSRAAGPAYTPPDTTNYLTEPPPASGAPSAPDDIAQPQTQQDYDAIPSGAMFVDPDDGQTYVKP